MEVVRDVREKGVIEVQRAYRGYVYLMVEEDVVNSLSVAKVHKEVPCSAKLMVVVRGVYMKDVPKVQKEVHSYAKLMVVGKDVHSEGVFAQKVFTGVLYSVWPMGVVRGVPFLVVLKVLGEELIVV